MLTNCLLSQSDIEAFNCEADESPKTRTIDSISDLANFAWDVYNARAEACPTYDMDGSYYHYDPDADDTANDQITALAAMFGFEFKDVKREMDRMEHAAMEQDYERYAMGGN